MVKLMNLQPRYGIRNKIFVRPNNVLEEDYLSMIRAIRKSEKDIENGRVFLAEEVFKELKQKYEY